jgi:hypothetical protein
MSGTGYYDEDSGFYRALSVETWDNYDGSSAGGPTWEDWATWNGNAQLPLTFTTGVTDYGSKELLQVTTSIQASHPVQTTITYGDTVDSSGGSIDSPSTYTVNPGDTSVPAFEARYFQFTVSITVDSAGGDTTADYFIAGITTNLGGDTVSTQLSNVDSSTLSGTVGERDLAAFTTISSLKSIVITPHQATGGGTFYVNTGYVASGYFTPEGGLSLPHVVVEKGTPNKLYIYDIADNNTAIDCTFDAVATGYAALSVDDDGNITQ